MAEEKKQKRWKVILNTVTLGALVLLVYLVRHDVIETMAQLDDIQWWILLLMIPAQGLNFYSYALMYDDLLRFLGAKIKTSKIFRITLELNFVNHVFPSGGVSGFSYFSLRLRPLGVKTATSTLIQLMRFVLVFVSFQAVLAFGVLALAFSGAVNNFVLLIAGSISTLLIAGTALLAYVIGSKQRINMFFTALTRFVNKIVGFFRRKNQETINIAKAQKAFGELHENYLLIRKDFSVLRKPLMHSFLANLTEIVTLYLVFVAFGFWVNPGAVILAYAVANFAGLISVLPGGVGVYEALMTAVLTTAGVPAGISFPVVIMYRVLTMAVQLPPGYVLYHKAVQDNDIKL
jgi:uncharacterized protein (TIRG00374 family)